MSKDLIEAPKQSPIPISYQSPVVMLLKCISKVLANIFQSGLPVFIDQSQSAFIKGRLIIDNALLIQELVQGSHRDDRPPR